MLACPQNTASTQSQDPSFFKDLRHLLQFIFGATWSAQPEASQADNALELREQHFDLFAFASGLFVRFGTEQGAGHVS